MLNISDACKVLLELMTDGLQTFIVNVLGRVLDQRMNSWLGDTLGPHHMRHVLDIFLGTLKVTPAAGESDPAAARTMVVNLFFPEGRLESNTRPF